MTAPEDENEKDSHYLLVRMSGEGGCQRCQVFRKLPLLLLSYYFYKNSGNSGNPPSNPGAVRVSGCHSPGKLWRSLPSQCPFEHSPDKGLELCPRYKYRWDDVPPRLLPILLMTGVLG